MKITTLFSLFVVWKLCCVLRVCDCDMMVFAAVIGIGLIVSCDIQYMSVNVLPTGACISISCDSILYTSKHSRLKVILFCFHVIRM